MNKRMLNGSHFGISSILQGFLNLFLLNPFSSKDVYICPMLCHAMTEDINIHMSSNK